MYIYRAIGVESCESKNKNNKKNKKTNKYIFATMYSPYSPLPIIYCSFVIKNISEAYK